MKENAYFTVEAALVFPVVVGTILFIIYMMLFQYNRCLLEQDIGAVALWGSRLEGADLDGLSEQMQSRLTKIYREKYIAWEMTLLNASRKKKEFSVQGGGRLALLDPMGAWTMEAVYQYDRLLPVSFIRLCRGAADLLEGEQEK